MVMVTMYSNAHHPGSALWGLHTESDAVHLLLLLLGYDRLVRVIFTNTIGPISGVLEKEDVSPRPVVSVCVFEPVPWDELLEAPWE